MRKFTFILVSCVFLLILSAGGQALAGTTYYVNPAQGSDDGDGSAAKPWKTLETVIANGQLKSLKGGDTLELESGIHGAAKFSGDNDAMITIAAGKGQRPQISQLTFHGKNWTVRGLVISSSFGKEPYKGNMVTFGENGESSKLTVEDCYIFTEEDASNWDAKQWMAANSGINMGRNGTDMTVRNCYVHNVRFGISLCSPDSMCEGNVITDYSGDGIRGTRDGDTMQYNIIKNIYVSAADGDPNHDDGIQTFLFNKGSGLIKNMKTIGNIIIAHEDPNQKWKNTLQGLGYFDGPRDGFVISDNVVNVDAYHGISIYNCRNSVLERNVVWTAPGEKIRSWMYIGGKDPDMANNISRNNYSNKYSYDKKNPPKQENDQISTEKIYNEALEKQFKVICDKFGESHFVADRPRMVIKKAGPATAPTTVPAAK